VLGRPLSFSQQSELRGLRGLRLHELQTALEWMDNPWDDVAATSRKLLAIAREAQPDIVHLNEFAYGALDWPAPVLMVGHSCIASWWRAVEHEEAPARYDHYRAVVRRGLAAARWVVAPSATMLGELQRAYGPFGERTRTQVVANGVELSAFQPLQKREMILCAGRIWDRAKNAELLEQVAPKLAWPVYVVGETRNESGTPATLSACYMLGGLTRSKLGQLLARTAIYTAPARYEPFGLAIVEAASSGCALVLGRIDSLLENWSDAACFVDPEDPQELQYTLQALIGNRGLRERWAWRARRRARHFGVQRMAAAYTQLYQQLLAAPSERVAHEGGPACAS
jgi:glycosyltransferase involved in cell wall biosynthesis